MSAGMLKSVIMPILAGILQFILLCGLAAILLGGGTAVTADVIPGLASWATGALHGLNLVGLRRRGFTASQISAVRSAYSDLFVKDGLFAEKLDQLKTERGEDEMVSLLVSFIEATDRIKTCASR